MLQLNVIRNHPDQVKERLALRNFRELELVDQILDLDEEKKKLTHESEEIKARINAISREIGSLMKSGQADAVSSKKAEVEELKLKMSPMETALAQRDQQIHDLLVKLPNMPHSSVPKGHSAEDNEIVREGGNAPALPANPLPHWDLAKRHKLIDFDLGVKLTGSGFPVYLGKGARLQRAMIQFFLDYNTSAGYMECQPPHMVNESSAYGTGQLPDKEGQMYHVVADEFYLIPTAEVPVTNIFRDEIINQQELPVKMTAYTPCFRREAGSYGKDVRGLNRLHQFDKVEIVQLVHPEKSYDTLEEMVKHVEGLLQKLGLQYRILRLCGGDMGFTSALTYDFEVYSAAQGKWLEVSSVSNFETFQTNRMKIRFKDEKGKSQLLHSLNGSSLALPRILAALLENCQTENSIRIPEALQPYFGSAEIL